MTTNSVALNEEVPQKASNTASEKVFLFPWQRMDMILSTIAINLLSLVLPIMILQLYDRIIPNQGYSTLTILSVGVIIAALLETLLRFSRSHILTWLGGNFEKSASQSAFSHLMQAKEEEKSHLRHGQQIQDLESVSTLREFLAGQGFLTLFDLPFVLLFLSVIAFFAGKLVLVPIVVLSSYVLVSLYIGHKIRAVLEGRMDLNNRRYNMIIEMLTNFHTLRAHGMEQLLLRRYEKLYHQCAQTEYKLSLYSSEARELGSVFSNILFTGVVAVGALEVIHNTLSFGVMSACIILSNRTLQPVQSALSVWLRIQHFKIAQKRFGEIFSLPVDVPTMQDNSFVLQGKISLKNITYQYPDAPHPILKDVNLEIEPGTIVAVMGNNGCGKTTLANLLLQELTPTKGEIFYDDKTDKSVNSLILQQSIAYLPPIGQLFNGTLLENMTLFQNNYLVKDALKLSQELGLDHWVNRQPKGYDTFIGQSISQFVPLGIVQRICLIRALLTQPRFLILDEAHTSLDDEGDAQFMTLLKKLRGGMTIMIITHRPSMYLFADKSYEIKDGYLKAYCPSIAKIKGEVPSHGQ